MPVSCKMKLHINRSAESIFVWFTFYNSWLAMYRHLHEVCLPAGVHHKFKSQKYPTGWWAQATPLWLQNCRSLPPWFRSPGICFCLSVKSLRKDPLHKCVTHKNARILPSCVRISASPGPADATSKFEQSGDDFGMINQGIDLHETMKISGWKSSLCFPVFCKNSFFLHGF